MRFAFEAGSATEDLACKYSIRGMPVVGSTLLDKGVEETLRPIRERGLEPCQLGLFEFNPLLADANLFDRLDRLIGIAADIGCPWVAITGGSYQQNLFGAEDPRNATPAAIDAVARALARPVAAAEKRGVHLTVEPYLKSVAGTPARCASLVAKVGSPALKITFDPTSLYDFAALVEPTPFIEEMARQLSQCIGLVHLKEVALSEGFHLHAGLVPIGRGRTDWGALLRAVAPFAPADSWVLLEHVAPEDAESAIGQIRAAAEKVGVRLR